MTTSQAVVLVGAGLVAGAVNTLAGGGSLLTVPILILAGLPASVANGTNRLGVLVQGAVSAAELGRRGAIDWAEAMRVLPPLVIGGAAGAVAVSHLADHTFERAFGLVMLLLLAPTLRPPRAQPKERVLSRRAAWMWLLVVGAYGGAFQAGIGLLLMLVLARCGYDLMRANGIKVAVVFIQTIFTLPVFVLAGQIAWLPGLLMSAGFAAGGSLGARAAVAGGERALRPVLAVSVAAMAGRLLGLY
ncbi:MAG TPA: sulfite exporter TauE/SafE family protein [Candidatus Limnocylindrales bacterium]|nr:sulfite exporter TauE/SafE family protein [Candidatus Limnocylindrales bacterium]